MEIGFLEKRNKKKDKRKERKRHPYRHLGSGRSMDFKDKNSNS